jgi:hypothetical protein
MGDSSSFLIMMLLGCISRFSYTVSMLLQNTVAAYQLMMLLGYSSDFADKYAAWKQ